MDRRCGRRVPAELLTSVTGTRIRPAHGVLIVDMSTCGALVEGTLPFAPGCSLVLEMSLSDRDLEVPCRVVRSFVSKIGRQSKTRYRGALAFAFTVEFCHLTKSGRVVDTRDPVTQPPRWVTSGSRYTPGTGSTRRESGVS